MIGLPHSTPLGWNEVYIVQTMDGSETIYNRILNSTYHSTFGAVAESRHVFLQAGLETQKHKPRIRILEFGFGTGLNAFLAFLFSKKYGLPVEYTGIEAYPIIIEIAQKLDYPGYLHANAYREVFLKMHSSSEFNEDQFSFKLLSAFTGSGEFDCIFFDAFAPAIQPEVWQAEVFEELFRSTAEGGCLVTYCAQGEVRRRMQQAGFKVERIPGAPGKREMLRALK